MLLHMDVQADEDDSMACIGYAFERFPKAQGCDLAISPRVSESVAADSIKMLFMFNDLRQLQLRFDFDDILITQPMVCAIAELLHLTSLHLLHGSLHPEVDVSHWTSLRSLAELKLLPGDEGGLRAPQVEQVAGLSSNLTSLALRLHPQEVPSDGLWHLADCMTQLQELSLCPLPEACAAADLRQLLEMRRLARLQLGTRDAAQVMLLNEVKVPRSGPQLSLLVRDACEPGPAADILTVIGWTLPQHLTALSIGPLAAPCPNDVLVTLATLVNLRHLELQLVAPPGQHVSGTVELLTLSPCRQLTCLEVLTSSRLYVPFTLKTVSLATLAWPKLAALRLSLAGRRELMPEALDMLDNFLALKELQLFSPLEDSPLEDLQTSTSGADALAAGTAGSGWASWAAAGLSTLGLLGGSAATTNGTKQRTSNSGSLGGAGRSSDTGAGPNSPLSQDWHQRTLVQQRADWQQHEAAHKQHLQEQQRSRQDGVVHSQHLSVSTLQDKQRLPPAVSSFQQHKLVKADSLWGNGSRSSQAGQQPGLSEPWSPTWLVRSFMPFASPTSPGPLSTADSLSTQQQHNSSWGLLDACRGAAVPRAASMDSSQQQLPAPSRLQHSSSLAGSASTVAAGTMRRTATNSSGHGAAAELATAQPRGSSPSAVAVPGQDLAMYRATGLLLPLNLNYMPRTLTELCLQSYHLVAIGMPQPRRAQLQQASTVPTSIVPDDQPAQQDDGAGTAPEPNAGGEADAAASSSDGQQPEPSQQQDACLLPPSPTRAAKTDAGAAGSSAVTAAAKPAACSAGGCAGVTHGASSSSLARLALPQLPLPHLLHLELDGCRIDDDTLAALLMSSPALRALEVAGLEGLTDRGLSQVSTLQHLTRLCVEAEDTARITLASLAAVRRLRLLKKLHWCSKDSLHGPLDADLLTAQLSGLTGLRQLVLLVAPDSEAYACSGWRNVLQRRLPLCRLVLRRELLQVEAWGDVPAED